MWQFGYETVARETREKNFDTLVKKNAYLLSFELSFTNTSLLLKCVVMNTLVNRSVAVSQHWGRVGQSLNIL